MKVAKENQMEKCNVNEIENRIGYHYDKLSG